MKGPRNTTLSDEPNHFLSGFEQAQQDLIRDNELPEDQRTGGHPDYWRGYAYGLQAKAILAAHGHTMASWLEAQQ